MDAEERWARRMNQQPLKGLPSALPGEVVYDPAMIEAIRISAYFEEAGGRRLARDSARSEGAMRDLLKRQAGEEVRHAALLRSLLPADPAWQAPASLRIARWLFTGPDRAVESQMVCTLAAEAVATALYRMIASQQKDESLKAVLYEIVNEEMTHVDGTAEVLAGRVAALPWHRRLWLRVLRAGLEWTVILAHALGHRLLLQPLVEVDARRARGEIMKQVRLHLRASGV